MLIQELSRQASLDLLARMRLGRLACAQGAQPYVTPIYFVSHLGCLYGFSTLGQKIEWMRENPLVCVEIDEVTTQRQWSSVVVFGQYEELPHTPANDEVQSVAERLFRRHPMWWEPASVPLASHEPRAPILFRIRIRQLTGRRIQRVRSPAT